MQSIIKYIALKIELKRLEQFNGHKAQIYSVIVGEDNETRFEKFLCSFYNKFPDKVKDILERIKVMNNKTGAREIFFKLNEGNLGDGVAALYDEPDSNLRLYCIRYGNIAIILGGGGPKSKNIRTYQEDPDLYEEVSIMKKVSQIIKEALKNRDLVFDDNGLFSGELKLDEDEY